MDNNRDAGASAGAIANEVEDTVTLKGVGRPTKILDMDYVVELLWELHLPVTKVAKLCGVSRQTLYTRLREEGVDMTWRRYSIIFDEDLQTEVKKIKEQQPNAGLTYLTGHLRSKSIFVQRRRVLETLHAVDPEGVKERLHGVTTRRSYSVPCPNFSWHLDGHHKMIHWKFVIHAACVDGFSRLIVFLHCSDNNLSATVEDLFMKASENHGCPLHVRTDHGGENVGVWHRMTDVRGQQTRPVLVGSSVHNTRVERLHLDVKQQVVEPFKSTFLDMEASRILDRENPVDIFCLHYVFLPRINAALEQFAMGHNYHSLRTEQNQSPLELFYLNKHLLQQYQAEGNDAVRGFTFAELTQNDLPYVSVTRTECPLTRADMDHLKQLVDPLSNKPVDQYLRVTEFVRDCLLRN